MSTSAVEVPKKESFELELIGLKYVTEIMEMASVSRLGLIHKAYDKHKVDKSLLPVYVDKKRLTFSASKLLADLGKPLSAVAFNKLLPSAKAGATSQLQSPLISATTLQVSPNGPVTVTVEPGSAVPVTVGVLSLVN